MPIKCLLLIVSVILWLCPSLRAQTIEWAIYPRYDSLEYIDENHLLFSQNGKTGILSTDGIVNVPADYDQLRMLKNGIILAINHESANRIRLMALIDGKSFSVTPIKAAYYLTQYSFFSEGKMCVQDAKGKLGYIDPSGNMVIRCRYDKALPFSNGRAAVKIGRENGYITSTGAIMRLKSTATHAETFSFHEGTAVVFKVTRVSSVWEGKVIGMDGSELRDWTMSVEETRKLAEKSNNYSVNGPTESVLYQFTDNRSTDSEYTAFAKNSSFGYYKDGQSWIIPQFAQTKPFMSGLALVKMNDKWGMIKRCPGGFGISIEKSIVELKKEAVYTASFSLNVPTEWQNKALTVQMAANSTDYHEMAVVDKLDNTWKYEYPIDVQAKPSSLDFHWRIMGDGLLLADDLTNYLTITYRKAEVDLTISNPTLLEEKADENHCQTIVVGITNKGDEELKLHVFFKVDKYPLSSNGININLQPGQTRRVETRASNVDKDESKHVTVLVTGDDISRTVSSQLFFKSHYK